MPRIPGTPVDLPTERQMQLSAAPLAGITLGVGAPGFALAQLLNWQNSFPDGWRELSKIITLVTSGGISAGAFATTMQARDDLTKVGNGFAGGMLAITVLEAIKEGMKYVPPLPFSIPTVPFLNQGDVRIVDRRTGTGTGPGGGPYGPGYGRMSQSQAPVAPVSPPRAYRTDARPEGYRVDAGPQGYRTDATFGGFRG